MDFAAVPMPGWLRECSANYSLINRPMLYRLISKAVRFLRGMRLDVLLARIRLFGRSRQRQGTITACGWDIAYHDPLALASSLDVLVQKGWNDFVADGVEPTIIDCGANIGISVLQYKRLYPRARIIAFEADPEIFSLMKRNLLANGAGDVDMHQQAVWISNEPITFFCEGTDGGRIVSGESLDKAAEVTVQAVDLRQYLNKRVDLLKIDIEGTELEVVPALGECLRNVRNIIVECHINSTDGGKFARLLAALDIAGFQMSINSYGLWRDLIRKPMRVPQEFDQYFLVAGFRQP